MNILGMNFSEIKAFKNEGFRKELINNKIEFDELKFDSTNLLKESEIVTVKFNFQLTYEQTSDKKKNKKDKSAEIALLGYIALSANDAEKKDLQKDWKKKKINPELRLRLINYLLKKCSTKALQIQEDLALPTHITFPQVRPQKKD